MELAARDGHPVAQRNMGLFFTSGQSKNPKLSFEWYLRAATQGEIDSMYEVALMYADGLGVDEDKVLSLAWLLALEHQLAGRPMFDEARVLKGLMLEKLGNEKAANALERAKTLVRNVAPL